MSLESWKEHINLVYKPGIDYYAELLRRYDFYNFKKVLDIGCGPGYFTFANGKANEISIGIDINEYLLGYAQKTKEKKKIKNTYFLKSDSAKLPFDDETFDGILMNSVLMYVDKQKSMKELSRVLKPNGVVIMFFLHGYGYYFHRLFVRSKNLREILATLRVLVWRSVQKKFNENIKKGAPISFSYVKKLGERNKIFFEKIENPPHYNEINLKKYLGFICMFAVRGVKK